MESEDQNRKSGIRRSRRRPGRGVWKMKLLGDADCSMIAIRGTRLREMMNDGTGDGDGGEWERRERAESRQQRWRSRKVGGVAMMMVCCWHGRRPWMTSSTKWQQSECPPGSPTFLGDPSVILTRLTRESAACDACRDRSTRGLSLPLYNMYLRFRNEFTLSLHTTGTCTP